MTFAAIPSGAEIFVDANTLIYHFTNHGKYGSACTDLLDRIEHQELRAYVSANVLSDVVHRLMTVEAMDRLGWPATGLAARLKKHHKEIPTLGAFRQALVKITQLGMQVLPLTESIVLTAAVLSQQYELLTGDASIVAIMQQQGLTILASRDGDFDRVPRIKRYGPV